MILRFDLKNKQCFFVYLSTRLLFQCTNLLRVKYKLYFSTFLLFDFLFNFMFNISTDNENAMAK